MQLEFRLTSQPGLAFTFAFELGKGQDDAVQTKIKSFGQLENGWDFGAGSASPPEVIDKALQVYKVAKLLGFKADAFPGVDGEVAVAFYANDHTVEIRVNKDLTLDLVHEVGIGAEYEQTAYKEGVPLPEVISYLSALQSQVITWNLSGLSTWRDTTPTRNDLGVTLSTISKAAYPYLTETVQTALRPKELVSTLNVITKLQSKRSPFFFGSLMPMSWHSR